MDYTVLSTEPCGCKLFRHPGRNMNLIILYCPKHEAAPELYEALKVALEGSEVENGRVVSRATPTSLAILQGFEALAEADGK